MYTAYTRRLRVHLQISNCHRAGGNESMISVFLLAVVPRLPGGICFRFKSSIDRAAKRCGAKVLKSGAVWLAVDCTYCALANGAAGLKQCYSLF